MPEKPPENTDSAAPNGGRLRMAAEAAPVLIWVSDERKKGIYFNQRWLDFTGRSMEQELGDGWLEAIHPEDRENTAKACLKAFDKREEFRIEFRMRRADGEYRWVIDHGVPRFTDEGRFSGYIGSCIDVTDLKKAETALEFQKYALDQSSIVAITDVKGTITYVNDKFCEISGYSQEELIGQNHRIINSGFHPTEFFREMYRTISHGKVWRGEIRNRRKDGSFYWVDTTIVPSIGLEGKPEAYVAIRTDITDRKIAEQALIEREERYELVLAGTEAAIWDWDVLQKRVVFSPRWKQLRGLSDEEVTDSEEEWIKTIHPDDRERVLKAVQDHFDGRTPIFSEEYRICHKEGHWIWIQDRGIARRDASGRVVRMAGSETDISERRRAEENLRASEERYRAVVESQSEMLCRFRPDGTVLFVNGPYAQAFGKTPEEMAGQNFWELISGEDKDSVRAMLNKLTPETPEMRIENRLRTTGGVRWTLWTNRALKFDTQGRAVEVQSTGIDITDRKRIELDLEFQKYALDQSSIVAITDVKGTITYVNDKFCEISGYSREELIGENHRIINSGLHPTEFFREMYRTISRGKVWRGEIRNRRKDGSFYWVDTTIVPSVGPDGKPQAYVAIRTDITERKQAETDLEFQKYALDQSSIVAITDVKGAITYVNDKFCEISGYSQEELIGQNHRIINSGLHPTEFFREMYRTISRGNVWRGEIRNRRKDGSFYWVDTTIVPSVGVDGKPQAYVAIRNDITEQKRAEEALKGLNMELEGKVRERTAQLEVQSQRLRMLMDQLAMTEQIERKRIAALIHDHLQQILVAGKFQMGQALRNVEKGDLKKLEVNIRQGDEFLNEAIRASKSLTAELRPPVLYEGGLSAAVRWLAAKYKEDHDLDVYCQLKDIPDLPDNLKIIIFEAVRELLFNIVKHARVKAAYLTIRQAPGNELYICVEDQGAGFDVARQQRTTEKGFGLFNICERLKLLDAEIHITSFPGKGTKIEIKLPLAIPAPEKHLAASSQKHRFKKQQQIEDSRIISILMADDHPVVREGIITMLDEHPELKVIAQAENGLEAVEKVRVFVPDVVIMDINMPELNGIEATEIIKNEFPKVRVIGLSVQDEVETFNAMKNAGAETLLNKAGDPRDLISAILGAEK